MLRVNLRNLRPKLLQTVNQAAHTPCPLTIGAIVLESRIQAVEVMLTTIMMLAKLFIVIDLRRDEGSSSNRSVIEELTRQRYHVSTNHQRIGSLTRLRIADMGFQRQHLLTNGNIDNECIAVHVGLYLTGLYSGFGTDAIVLNHMTNVTTTLRPVLEFLDTFQGIGQVADNGQLVCCRHHGCCKLARILYVIDKWRLVLLGRRCGQSQQRQQGQYCLFHSCVLF